MNRKEYQEMIDPAVKDRDLMKMMYYMEKYIISLEFQLGELKKGRLNG